jgi:hypothetical protein
MADRKMTERQTGNRLGVAGWITLAVLAGFLAVAIFFAVHAWVALAGVAMSGAGWFFLVCGIVFTILVGGVLMGLVFYSSRHDYDR